MQYKVVYVSNTGNTERLAKVIYASLPGTDKDIRKLPSNIKDDAEVYFVGFWTNRGSCSADIIDFLSELQGRKIVLFGTCGMGANEEYYKLIESKVKVWIPEENEYLGCFLCQGKMGMSVRDKYEEMLQYGKNTEQLKQLIRNFDEALIHPNDTDLRNAKQFTEQLTISV